MDIIIDVFSPCLENVKTGEIVETFFAKANNKELKGLQKQGWNFNWASKELKNEEIYKIIIENDNRIQGLIAIQNDPQNNAIYVHIAESAPFNLGRSKQYKGVGGHLFAIAVKRSMDLGYDGYLYMDAKNLKLVEHYEKTLNAIFVGKPTPYRMYVNEKMQKSCLKNIH